MFINKTDKVKTETYVYWMEKRDFMALKASLPKDHRLEPAFLTPCEVLKAAKNTVYYASPAVWSRVCVRQGSWYRDSDKNDKYMVVTAKPLAAAFNSFFEVKLSRSNVMPERLPTLKELQALVEDEKYSQIKPRQWEKKGIVDAVMFKILFTVTRFWGIGDNLKSHWLTHRANHANHLAQTFSTEIDGQKVPYSISENAGVCSSCVEFFNIIEPETRKLVRSCPGAITFGKTERDIYYDVDPSKQHLEIIE